MLSSRTIMFGGKGGVGKTTCAAAAALHCALGGEKTLVVSTDPTPSLADIFEIHARSESAVPVADNLWMTELGLDEIKAMWDRKFGREVYEVFSAFVDIEYDEFSVFLTSILPGLAEEFMVDYIRELAEGRVYDRIIWDTAPLGQTLGLLKTPSMLREHLRPAPKVYSRLRLGDRSRRPILKIIQGWEALSQQDMDFLQRDVTIILVLIPEALAVRQLERIDRELRPYGLAVRALIVNSVVTDPDSDFMQTRAQEQGSYRDYIRRTYGRLGISEVPLFPGEIKGISRLEKVRCALFGNGGKDSS